MTDVVTLLLADHHVLVAEGLGMLLDSEDDLDVVDLAHHSDQAVWSVPGRNAKRNGLRKP